MIRRNPALTWRDWHNTHDRPNKKKSITGFRDDVISVEVEGSHGGDLIRCCYDFAAEGWLKTDDSWLAEPIAPPSHGWRYVQRKDAKA